MAESSSALWRWHEKSREGGGFDGSTFTKMFRNSSLSPTASLAREAIQNSSDAATRFKQEHPDESLNLRAVFRFVELSGQEKKTFVESLGLDELRKRRESASFSELPLGAQTSIDVLSDPASKLTLLYVEDYSTHGLYGHPCLTSDSVMYRAMLEVGDSIKDFGAGGSYGFGKSALVGVSKVKTVVAYSAFEPRPDDPTRTRLLGITYWPSHRAAETNYNGLAIFDVDSLRTSEKPINPFEDDQADELAQRLGFQPRKTANLNELGTTFLLVDPLVDPEQLEKEVATWWWPALEDHKFDVKVILPDGTELTPRPATIPGIKQFLTPYRIAKKEHEPQDPNKEQLASNVWRTEGGAGASELGSLGLVVDDDAIGPDGEPAEGLAIVALMRDPKMVIRYEQYRQKIPIRGAFVASTSSNDLLRKTEPWSHDLWSTDPSTDVTTEATERAIAILTRIRNSVSRMAREVTPPPPRTPRALSHFAKLMSGFVGGKRGPKPPPPPGGEPIELQFPRGAKLEAVGDHEVRVLGAFSVKVADKAGRTSCRASIKCELHVMEDENPNGGRLPVRIAPEGKDHDFHEDGDGLWGGTLSKGEKVVFAVVSEPYSNLWTTTLQPIVTADWNE